MAIYRVIFCALLFAIFGNGLKTCSEKVSIVLIADYAHSTGAKAQKGM
jgi:hypothetical protein